MKLAKVLKEQAAVRLMYERGVDPNLIPVEEPWVVVGAAKASLANFTRLDGGFVGLTCNSTTHINHPFLGKRARRGPCPFG